LSLGFKIFVSDFAIRNLNFKWGEESVTRTKRILLPQPIEAEAVELIKKAGFEIVLSPDPKPETVLSLMKGVQAIILRTGIRMTRELMSQADDLWVISRTGAGVDNVDVQAATEMGILVTCVPRGEHHFCGGTYPRLDLCFDEMSSPDGQGCEAGSV
jgi:hypothetical protein